MKITIGGKPGSGKSSVGKELAKRLGLKHYSMGDFMGELATEKGMSLLELSEKAEKSADIDHEIDERQKRLNDEDGFVIDSRLGFHFIPDAIKIFLDVDPQVGAKRIFKDDRADEPENESEASTAELIEKRIRSEKKRYMEYYSLDPYLHDNYDLLIDTSEDTVEQTVERILKFLGGDHDQER